MSSVLYKPVRYLLGATRCAVKAPAHDLEDWRLTWNMPIDGGPLAPKEIRIKIDLEAVLQPEAATQRNAPPAGLPVNIEQTCSNRANHAGQAGRVKGAGGPAIPRTSPQIGRKVVSFTTQAGAGLALLAALVAGCGTAAASHSAAPKPTRTPHSQHASPPMEATAGPAAHSPTPTAHHHRHHHHHAQPLPVVITPPPPPPAPPSPTMAPPVTVTPIPQGNGGDQDGDNNGGPSDGDGNV